MRISSIVGLGCLLVLLGCDLSPLQPTSPAMHAEWVAPRSVSCVPGEQGCREKHLARGEMCFGRAKQGDTNYQDCAVRNLALGLDMSAPDEDRDALRQPYLYLLEVLRLRRDTAGTGAKAAPFAAQLESRAQMFRQLFPDAPEGGAYLLSVYLRKAAETVSTSPVIACRALKDAGVVLRGLWLEEGGMIDLDRKEAQFEELKTLAGICADA
jgi:hypothetical protein